MSSVKLKKFTGSKAGSTSNEQTMSAIRALARDVTMNIRQPTDAATSILDRQLYSKSEFTVGEELGAGGMGRIYRARQKDLQRDVAIKQLHPHLFEVDRIREGFFNEAVITGKLAHPNVVPVYGLSQSERNLSMQMKLISGCTLEDVVCPQTDQHREMAAQFDTHDCIEILIAICNPVAFAHSQEIIHRDIKPGNIMVGEFGEMLLLDWGLACSISSKGELDSNPEVPHVAQITGPEGTWSYMAPEMMDGNGKALGIHSDIYLLGACLYFILTGKPPHRHRHERDFSTADERDYCEPLPEHLDTELRRICEQAMARDPARRYSNVKDFQKELKDYLRHQESRQIANDAGRRLAQAKAEYSAHLSESERVSLFYNLADSLASYRQALTLWEGNSEARLAHQNACLDAAKMVSASGEYNTALVYLTDAEGKDAEDLRSQIQKALWEARKTGRARALLRVAAIVLVGLSIATIASAWAVYHFMENTAENVADQTRKSLISDGERDLKRVVLNAATAMTYQRQTVANALNHFIENFKLVYEPDMDFKGSSAADDQLLHFKPSTRYSRLTDKGGAPTLVTFDGFVFSPPPNPPSATEMAQRHALNRIVPQIKQLYASNQGLVIRYYMGFEHSKLFAEYPGTSDALSDYDPTAQGWYLRGKSTSIMNITPPYLDKSTGRPILSAVLPITNPENQFIGVAGLDIYVKDLLKPLKVNPNWGNGCKIEIAKMVGDEVEIVFSTDYKNHPDKPNSEFWVPREHISNVWGYALSKLKTDLRGGHEGVINLQRDNRPVLWGYAPLGIQDAFVLFTVDHETLTHEADEVRNTIISHNTAAMIHIGKVVGLIFGALLLLSLLLAYPLFRSKLTSRHIQ